MKDNLKALIVALEYPPILGGGSSYVLYLVKTLIKNNVDVVVLASGKKDIVQEEEGCRVYRDSNLGKLYYGQGDFFEGVESVISVIRKENPDVVHSIHSLPSLMAQAANCNFGIPHFITHHKTPEFRKDRVRVYSKWSVFDLANQKHEGNFIICSKAFRNCLLEHGVDSKKIELIYPGVDEKRFQKLRNDQGVIEIRNELGLSEKDRFVVIPAKLRERKGVDFALKGLAKVKTKGGEVVKVLITGLGEVKSDDERIVSLETTLGENSLIHFRYIEDSEMPLIYNAADLVLLPSKVEGLGMALLEAMACGCAVVGTNVKGIREVIEDGVSGRLVEYGDTKSLAEAVSGILNDDELRRKYIKAGADLISGKFNLKKQGLLHKRAYKRSLANRKQSAGGIVYKLEDDGVLIYLAKHSDYGYVLPKGGKKEGEAWVEAAAREVREETGFALFAPSFLVNKIYYEFEKEGVNYKKEVVFYAFEVDKETKIEELSLEKGEKIIQGKWMSAEEAIDKLSHESEKRTIAKLQNLIHVSKET